jgi:hypothetical protein
MIVDMLFIYVSCHNECVTATGKTHRQFVSKFVGKFRRDFTGLERLADMICEYVMLALISACDVVILLF